MRLHDFLAMFDVLDVLYLAGVAGGVAGLLASPAPWVAGLWFAGCMFAAVHLLNQGLPPPGGDE